MKTRTDILNHLIQKHGLTSYCELGTQVRSINFDKIICKDKFCVDIDPKANADFIGSTDDFFRQLNRKFDLYFIDASHLWEDVRRDFNNAYRNLSMYGFLCLHDCNPETYERTKVPRPTKTGTWNGTVYKFASKLGMGLEEFYTVDIDHGCGIFRDDGMDCFCPWENTPIWEEFDANRKQYLKLISFDEFIKL